MDQNAEQAKELEATLASAQKKAANVKTEAWNPMENIPTVSAGQEWKDGMTLAGTFLETQRIVSKKFEKSKEKDQATGLPVGYRHILRTADGKKLGIWTAGELKMTFDKLQPGEYIELTYKGKGTNSKGDPQHFFDYKRGSTSH